MLISLNNLFRDIFYVSFSLTKRMAISAKLPMSLSNLAVNKRPAICTNHSKGFVAEQNISPYLLNKFKLDSEFVIELIYNAVH